MKTLFNDNWQFAKTEADSTKDNDFTGEYSPVQIPHDWLIYNADNLYETSYGRYKKTYDFGSVAGKSIRLYFEGVYQDSTVYVNGKEAFNWKYGYSSFEADITDYLHDGENEIEVLVRHLSPNSRWYSGAGIFRDIYLIETGYTYLTTDGIYYHTDKTESGFDVYVSAEVNMPKVGDAVEIELRGVDGRLLYRGEKEAAAVTIFNFKIESPEDKYIWDIDSPNLLNLNLKLSRGGKAIDENTQRVGLREFKFLPDSGFYINGRHLKINGVCLHHDLGCLGAAFNKAAAKRQLLKMREMGVNSVRTSHNMPAKAFMDLCDELGILVNSEAFDMWERPKTEFDYARYFDEWYKKDVASWIRRDRNHASVIMWSVGNEIYDTHVSPRGAEVAALLHAAVRENDPLKNAPTTIGSNYMPWAGAQNCAKEVDLAGYNYLEHLYMPHHEKYPDWCIYGSETTSGVKSRGIYHFPRSAAFLTHADLQCSSLGNCRAGISATTAQEVIVKNRDIDVCAGMYIWTGSDYIGEPSPYSTKNAYFGNIDTAGIEKDSFYLYKAAWTDSPVLRLFPYWDFNEGQLIDVVAYTNFDEVELFLNGKSCGKKTAEDYTVAWQIPYELGEIKAVAFDKDGKAYEASRHSFGDSKKIVLSANRDEVLADGEDIAVVTISTVDENGYPVDNARDRINIEVEGGRLVGFDNGDSTDYDSYKSNNRRLFSGKAAAYIASTDKAGIIKVTATSNGLFSAEITVNAVSADVRQGVSMEESIDCTVKNNENPLRKIELKTSGNTSLSPENPVCNITAELLPADTDYKDIVFSVVTNSGIVTNLAEVISDGNKAEVKANGDGEFRLRCFSLNGRRQPEIISELEFTASGFGQASINPYELVCGCLYNDSIKQLDEVQRGGVNIKKDNYIVGFTKTDFGKYGTDAFTVRIINWHSDAAFNFRVYLGHPDNKDSVCLGDFTYQANFEWQTYKDNSYTLPFTVKGMQDLYFEFDKNDLRVDFGGFFFAPNLKAYEVINAADCDLVHGDNFDIVGGAVNNIGNNVFLDFEDMDFVNGTRSITVTGKTRHDNDSIHVHFVKDNGETVEEIVEFPYSEGITSVTHELPDIKGKCTVKFRFLPGCDFDFESFRIERN